MNQNVSNRKPIIRLVLSCTIALSIVVLGLQASSPTSENLPAIPSSDSNPTTVVAEGDSDVLAMRDWQDTNKTSKTPLTRIDRRNPPPPPPKAPAPKKK